VLDLAAKFDKANNWTENRTGGRDALPRACLVPVETAAAAVAMRPEFNGPTTVSVATASRATALSPTAVRDR